MDVNEAKASARALMDASGLQSWGLVLTRGKKTVGITHVKEKTIGLSKYLIELNDWPTIEETVLHEIAHAIVWDQHGAKALPHGQEWQREARRLGCQYIGPKQRGVKTPPNNYAGTCDCGEPHSRDRVKAGAVYRCTICRGEVTWERKSW